MVRGVKYENRNLMNKQKVVITGIGTVTAIGDFNFHEAIVKTDHTNTKDNNDVKLITKDYLNFLNGKYFHTLDKSTIFALMATKIAVENSAIDFTNKKAGVILGTAFGTGTTDHKILDTLYNSVTKSLTPFMVMGSGPNASADLIAIEHKLHAFNYTISNAEISGLDAIGYAFQLIRENIADIIIAGGTEAYGSFFEEFYAASYPEQNVHKKETGTPVIFGEGSGIVILESLHHAISRNANILGEIKGFGKHFRKTQNGEVCSLKESVLKSFKDAVLFPKYIDLISLNANGNKTIDNMETEALLHCFGDQLEKTDKIAVKPLVGETFGAHGAISLIRTVHLLNEEPRQKSGKNNSQFKNALITSLSPQGGSASLIIGKSNLE
jgi:3-oxoacyl-[acyl-carrier-protein] synthase II